ncbi:unnamed protein product [Schistocephalus solidus]|uniref:C2H2-type domain-containing protein n=1 Tax=Schistocephalus solidus TaxID=70667 RepID=A0A183TIS4_SCHSO|nr:unnamed protein product [Schistocephalus solidus]
MLGSCPRATSSAPSIDKLLMSLESGTPNPDSSFKWKCFICNLGFTAKDALLHHLKTPAHRANIPTEYPNPCQEPSQGTVNQTPKPTPERPDKAPQTSALSASVSSPSKPDDLIELIRQMIREMLTKIIQEELRAAFSVSLSDLRIHDGKVDEADDRRLLVTNAELKSAPHCEYMLRTSTPYTESGSVVPRLIVAHSRGSPEMDNSEVLSSNVDKTYATVVLASRLIFFLVDGYKDAWAPVIRSNLVSPRLFTRLMEPGHQCVDIRFVDFSGYTVLSRCLPILELAEESIVVGPDSSRLSAQLQGSSADPVTATSPSISKDFLNCPID